MPKSNSATGVRSPRVTPSTDSTRTLCLPRDLAERRHELRAVWRDIEVVHDGAVGKVWICFHAVVRRRNPDEREQPVALTDAPQRRHRSRSNARSPIRASFCSSVAAGVDGSSETRSRHAPLSVV